MALRQLVRFWRTRTSPSSCLTCWPMPRTASEEAAFATGTGTGQPKGVVPAATTVASAAVATYAVGDVYTTQAALPARSPWSALVASHGLRTRPSSTRRGSLTPLAVRPSGPTLAWVNPRICWCADLREHHDGWYPPRLAPRTCFWVTSASTTSWIASACRCSTNPQVKGANQRPTGQAGWFGVLASWRRCVYHQRIPRSHHRITN